jgi:hypothetical protein
VALIQVVLQHPKYSRCKLIYLLEKSDDFGVRCAVDVSTGHHGTVFLTELLDFRWAQLVLFDVWGSTLGLRKLTLAHFADCAF